MCSLLRGVVLQNWDDSVIEGSEAIVIKEIEPMELNVKEFISSVEGDD